MLSGNIKKRESYRPVAPFTLEEKIQDYFIGPKKSPFMLFQHTVKEAYRQKLIGSIHADGTARVQTLTRESNSFMYELVKCFGEKTGIYVLLNTSLNLQGEPLTNSFEDTIKMSKQICENHVVVYNGKIVKI